MLRGKRRGLMSKTRRIAIIALTIFVVGVAAIAIRGRAAIDLLWRYGFAARPLAGLQAYADGQDAFLAGDYKKAEPLIRESADQGNALAVYLLGHMYQHGQGLPKDTAQSIALYRKAAEQGYASAQLELGKMYSTADGIEQNDTEAAKLFRQAADQENMYAQFELAFLYATGRGVEHDDKTAIELFTKAAERGVAKSQYLLGMMYFAGKGVPQDYGIAY